MKLYVWCIADDVCIDAEPVNCFSGLRLHFLHPLVCAVVSKGPFKELWRDKESVSLHENTDLNVQLILGAPEVMENPWEWPEAVRPSPEGYVVQGIVDWVALYSSSNCIQFVVGELHVLDILMTCLWAWTPWEGKWLWWSTNTISLLGLYSMV